MGRQQDQIANLTALVNTLTSTRRRRLPVRTNDGKHLSVFQHQLAITRDRLNKLTALVDTKMDKTQPRRRRLPARTSDGLPLPDTNPTCQQYLGRLSRNELAERVIRSETELSSQ